MWSNNHKSNMNLHKPILNRFCAFLPRIDMRRDVQEIFRNTPHGKQVMMFSATLSKEIRPVCKKFMQDVIPPTTCTHQLLNPNHLHQQHQQLCEIHWMFRFGRQCRERILCLPPVEVRFNPDECEMPRTGCVLRLIWSHSVIINERQVKKQKQVVNQYETNVISLTMDARADDHYNQLRHITNSAIIKKNI